MRPHRVRLTHSLVQSYGLGSQMLQCTPTWQSQDDISQFHADDYLSFLKSVTPENQEQFLAQMRRFNLGPVGEADCPVFDGMFDYFRLYSGASVAGAAMMNEQKAEICLNWAGGMHHAKKAEASGFCYINDIVLAILELLKTYGRVLYVDIDIHHGDGVEEAFYTTDRVMTVSFHKYGDFFPGTGALDDTGTGGGAKYSVNVPLQEGMDDASYQLIFQPVMAKVMQVYQPQAVVMCCGADSLSGDRLGCFNLSLEGHAQCIEYMASFNVPLLLLGGGGYTMRNVARCWCYETSRMLGNDLNDDLPEKALAEFDYYMDTHKLRITVSNMKNANSEKELLTMRDTILANLGSLPPAPSVQFAAVPPKYEIGDLPEEDPDVRGGGRAADGQRVVKGADYASDEEEPLRNEGEERLVKRSPPAEETKLGPASDGADAAAGMSAAAVAAAVKAEPDFKPKPPMIPDEATVTGAHVPVAAGAPAGVDIGVKIGADEAYLQSVSQPTRQASGGAAPLTTPAAPVVDDRAPEGNGAADVPRVSNEAAAAQGGPTDMELEEEAAVGTGLDAGKAPLAAKTDGPQDNAAAPDPTGGGG